MGRRALISADKRDAWRAVGFDEHLTASVTVATKRWMQRDVEGCRDAATYSVTYEANDVKTDAAIDAAIDAVPNAATNLVTDAAHTIPVLLFLYWLFALDPRSSSTPPARTRLTNSHANENQYGAERESPSESGFVYKSQSSVLLCSTLQLLRVQRHHDLDRRRELFEFRDHQAIRKDRTFLLILNFEFVQLRNGSNVKCLLVKLVAHKKNLKNFF